MPLSTVCVYMCPECGSEDVLPGGRNSAQDSFIKCGEASGAAVNQFYLLYIGGQLSLDTPWTLTPQEWAGRLLLLQLCCCRLVVMLDLFWYKCGSPEEKEQLSVHFAVFIFVQSMPKVSLFSGLLSGL